MKKIIFTIIALFAININAQEIHSKFYYKKYKKSIEKLESFLSDEGYSKSQCNIEYEGQENSYNYVFSKNDYKIFIIIPFKVSWIHPMSAIEDTLNDGPYIFTNKLKTFKSKNKNEIYIIKRS